MKSKIKFAIVGSGHIGKRHAEMIMRHPEAELSAMCDVLSIEELGAGNLNVPFFKSIEEFLDSKIDVDVISVCSPNGLHAKHSLMALEHHKHVVCEKPIIYGTWFARALHGSWMVALCCLWYTKLFKQNPRAYLRRFEMPGQLQSKVACF